MRNVKNLALCVLMLALVSTPAVADIHYVNPGDSIQEAINNAEDYDEIEVAPGIYKENIDFKGKAITLRSSGGPDVTTIKGDDTGALSSFRVVTCDDSEGPDTVLEGFTITGGKATGSGDPGLGGGMWIYDSSPIVRNCIFTGNHAWSGGGLFTRLGSPTVTDCTFTQNTAEYDGAGMGIWEVSPTVTNCTFTGNVASRRGGGIYSGSGSSPTVTNCILWGNIAPGGWQIYGAASVTYSDVQGGYTGTGNIDEDPMFADADGRLLAGSPCIDAGDDDAVSASTDLDGNPRIVGLAVDMGAYEFQEPLQHAAAVKTQNLIEKVVALALPSGIEKSLVSKLENAIDSIQKAQEKAAVNKLEAFINEVEAQQGKKIPEGEGEADELIDLAQAIIDLLEAG